MADFDETAWQDLATAAVTIREPILSAVAVDNTRLLQLITVGSVQIQRFIGRQYTAAEVAAGIPADLQLAATHYVAYLWRAENDKDGGNTLSESLGQYSVSKRAGGTPNPWLDAILGLLAPFRRRRCPVLVKWDEDDPKDTQINYDTDSVAYYEEDE